MLTLRTALLALFLLSSVALSAEPDTDLKSFEGVWLLEDAILAARDHKEDFKGMKLTITGDKYVIDFGDNSDKGTLKIDSSKKPKQIDITTRKDGPFKGRTLPGIYEFKGDLVVLCLNSEKPDRPTKFEAPEKSPMMLLTFKKQKK
ncbi:MAG: TIGR03067 domain-containing protein [Planctomycetia bacterium]|nr:TIGR03067 domain-containing protein [Planctomycetia bacterium]